MCIPTRSRLIISLTSVIALSLFLAVIVSCKKDDASTTPSSTSIQGNWRLTSLNVSPAYSYSGVLVSELVAPLNGRETNCIGSSTLMFNANGTITNNATAISACTNAATSKQLISTFFAASTAYTESDNQLIIRGPQTVTYTKTVGSSTATLVTSLSVNPGNQAIPTSYTAVLTKL